MLTLLLVNLEVAVGVHAHDDNVREDVDSADHVQDTGVVHGDLLGDLHHHEDDDQVGAAQLSVYLQIERLRGAWAPRTFEG